MVVTGGGLSNDFSFTRSYPTRFSPHLTPEMGVEICSITERGDISENSPENSLTLSLKLIQ